EEPSLRKTGTVVELDHPTRGKYLSVGNPIKLSDSISEVKRAPLLGEHTDEILKKVLGFADKEVVEIKGSGATGGLPSKDAAWRQSAPGAGAAPGPRTPEHRAIPGNAGRWSWVPGSPLRAAPERRGGVLKRNVMRIVVHGQQAFGKAVLEALVKRGDEVIAVYAAPEKPGQKIDPLKEAALAARLPVHQ